MFIFNGKKISLERDLIVERELVVKRWVSVQDQHGNDIGVELKEVVEIDLVTYPAASLQSADVRAELGITEVPDPVRPDERLHYVTENEDGTYDAVPRPREQITAPVWERIKARREQIKNGGAKVGTHWFHTDDASRIQQLGLVMMGAGIPANLHWKTLDGTFITMTQTLAGQISQAVATLDMQAFAAAEDHRAEMDELDNPFDYDYSTGWPEVYADTLVIE